MSTADVTALLPLLLLAGTIVIALFGRTFPLSLLGLAAAFVSLFFRTSHGKVTSLLMMDSYTTYYLGLTFASAFAIAILSHDSLRARRTEHLGEYDLVLLLATLGSAIVIAATHFASLFLGLEILSVSLYVLISYRRGEPRALEAGTKYLVLAGTSSAFLLFGMALLYASLGTMEFAGLAHELAAHANMDGLTLTGAALLATGIGFKLALAPFHMWSPDVYEGASAPVAGFIATISKGAMFALLLRLFLTAGLGQNAAFVTILALLSVASMFVGNLAALRQNNIKRLLAYSSIAHLGYLLVALLASRDLGARAAAFYLAAYFITTLTAFGVVSVLSGPDRDANQLSDYQGLFWKRPTLALMLSTALLSLAGMPLTAGFIGKFYLISAGVGSTLWALVGILVLNSAIGLYYYLRVIVALYTPAPALVDRAHPPIALSSGSTLAVLSVLLIGIGVYPSPLLQLIQRVMSSIR